MNRRAIFEALEQAAEARLTYLMWGDYLALIRAKGWVAAARAMRRTAT